MDTNIILAIGIAVVVLALVIWLYVRRRRSAHLQDQFGPEYDRAVESRGNRDKAEAELAAREKRVKTYDIRPLTAEERDRYTGRWTETKALFVNEPARAVTHADELLENVMATRGYPMSDFDQRADDLSVDHPIVIRHYRAGHDIAVRGRDGDASTEDLRQAFVHYETLFEELVTETDRESA